MTSIIQIGIVVLTVFLSQTPVVRQEQGGTVSGVLRGVDSVPAKGIRVGAMPVVEPADLQSGISEMVGIAVTDEMGRYRLENIPPGRYYIIAGRADMLNYYPGVTLASEARIVSLSAGAAAEAVDFSLLRVDGFKISGRLVGIPVDPEVQVTLTMPNKGAFRTSVAADGTFEFLKVLPGTYRLLAVATGTFAPSATITVSDRDLNDVELTRFSGPGVTIKGKVTGLSSIITSQPRARTLSLSLQGPNVLIDGVRMKADGSFEFNLIPPGRYDMRLIPEIYGIRPVRFEVSDHDIENLQLKIPYHVEIVGRVSLENAVNLDELFMIAAATKRTPQEASTNAVSVGHDGVFRFLLVEGEYAFTLRLPEGLVVKSANYKTTNLMKEPLTIDQTVSSPVEIAVTVGAAEK